MRTKTFTFTPVLQKQMDDLMLLLSERGIDLSNPKNPRALSESRLIKYLIEKELQAIRSTIKPPLPEIDHE